MIGTGKSRQRVKATIPSYDALRDMLARIPKRSPSLRARVRGSCAYARDFEGGAKTCADARI